MVIGVWGKSLLFRNVRHCRGVQQCEVAFRERTLLGKPAVAPGALTVCSNGVKRVVSGFELFFQFSSATLCRPIIHPRRPFWPSQRAVAAGLASMGPSLGEFLKMGSGSRFGHFGREADLRKWWL